MSIAHFAGLDRITLTGISGTGYHGVFDHEKAEGQTFLADVTLGVDLHHAGRSDDLSTTVDYGAIAQRVADVISGPAYDLIEALAAKLADTCLAHPRVQMVEVTVHKPQAPIEVPFTDAAVTIVRARGAQDYAPAPVEEPTASAPEADPAPGLVNAVLALGSNLGERRAHLRHAVTALRNTDGITVTAVSPVYTSAAVGGPQDNPEFCNAVVLVRTRLTPLQLLHAGTRIEALAGRTRTAHWGPRTLDVDLITYGEERIDSERLTVPHPRAHQRAFVLQPWLDVDPQATLPEWGRVADLLAYTDRTGLEQQGEL